MNYLNKVIRPFNPDITFTSGQCFRWKKNDDKTWQCIVNGKFAKIIGEYPNPTLYCRENDYSFWSKYFDSLYDYELASQYISKDNRLNKAVLENKGLILLRQPFFETLISFIISANNNIPRIKSIIENLCSQYGDEIDEGYCFPTPQKLASLSEKDLLSQGCGYRSRYIIETSKIVAGGYNYKKLINILLNDARDELCKFTGVGKKVADCILIYSLGRKDAFPVDTWIRKASIDLFGEELSDEQIRGKANERFGNNAALAQQYMFIAQRQQ